MAVLPVAFAEERSRFPFHHARLARGCHRRKPGAAEGKVSSEIRAAAAASWAQPRPAPGASLIQAGGAKPGGARHCCRLDDGMDF